jgi:hypothetical protein
MDGGREAMAAAIRWSVGVVGALSLLVSACGTGTGSASRTPTPGRATASPAAAGTPVPGPTPDLGQVQAMMYWVFPPGGSATACYTGLSFDRCPFTDRLRARLGAVAGSATASGIGPVCRCQNGYRSASVRAEVIAGRPVAHVVLTSGPSSTFRIDWAFVKSAGGWLADDSYCTAVGPASSIYAGFSACSS